jgi:hypothetical protein
MIRALTPLIRLPTLLHKHHVHDSERIRSHISAPNREKYWNVEIGSSDTVKFSCALAPGVLEVQLESFTALISRMRAQTILW